MGVVSPALAEMNQRNQAFWLVQNDELMRRSNVPGLCEIALQLTKFEQEQLVPIKNRMSFEGALARAELITGDANIRFASERARNAGRAPKKDALQALIEDLVEENPNITEPQLRVLLTRQRFPGLIEDVDDEDIWFKNKNGRSKAAKISGLKDRLSRAK